MKLCKHSVASLLILTALFCGFGSASSSAQASEPPEPKLIVEPAERLAFEPLSVKVENLHFGAMVQIQANYPGEDGVPMRSTATFFADENGTVDVARDYSTYGTYEGIEPHGLIWSAEPVGEPPEHWEEDPYFRTPVEFRAIVRPSLDNLSTVTLTTSHILRYRGPDTVREEIAEGDLRGVLYFPRGVESPPTLITMNGSDGGVYEPGAALIATRGFAVLALASHDYAGRPDDLALIPLEYWREAIDYMRKRFDDERTALLGMSRGGELALLVPSIWPDRVDAVVANVPSNVVNSACCNPETWSKAAFTLNGEPVAFWEPDLSYEGFDPTSGLPMSYRLTYLKAMLGPDTIGPAIEVEKIDAPILLISGDADRLWPGDIAAKMVEKRLREHGFAHEVVNVVHAGAGHWATSTTHNTSASPGLTEAGDRNDLPTGGTVRANARAIHASVKLQLDFLRKYARND